MFVCPRERGPRVSWFFGDAACNDELDMDDGGIERADFCAVAIKLEVD